MAEYTINKIKLPNNDVCNISVQTADTAIANGDKIVIIDSSDNNKIARTTITFDGVTENMALTPKGTWKEFNNYAVEIIRL